MRRRGTVATRAGARSKSARSRLDCRGIVYRAWRLVNRVLSDRGADMLQRPGDDKQIGSGPADIVKAAEKEPSHAGRDDDRKHAYKAERFHVRTQILRGYRIQSGFWRTRRFP